MFGELASMLAFGLASLGIQIAVIDSDGPVPFALPAGVHASVASAPFSPRATALDAAVSEPTVIRAWPWNAQVDANTFARPTMLSAPWVRLRLQPENSITGCAARLATIEGNDGSFWIGAEVASFFSLTETERLIIEAREEALGWPVGDGLDLQATCGQVLSAFLRERFSLILHEEIRESLFPQDRREKIRELWIRIIPGRT